MKTTFDTLDGNEQLVTDALATRDLEQAADAVDAEDTDAVNTKDNVTIAFDYPDHAFTASVSLTLPGRGEFDVETSVYFHHDADLRLDAFAAAAEKANGVAERLESVVRDAGYRPTRGRSGIRDHSAGPAFETQWSFYLTYK